MAETVASLMAELGLDPREFLVGMQQASKANAEFMRSMSSISKELGQADRQIEKTTVGTTALGVAFGNLLSDKIRSSAAAIQNWAESAVQTAATVERLAGVARYLGEGVGKSAAEIDKLASSLTKQGITTRQSYDSLIQMSKAQLDLSKATELATVAQNYARSSGENSSDTMMRLIRGIQTLQTETLRTAGVVVNLDAEYRKMADTLGKSQDSLTGQEKQQAALNAVIREGAKVNGIYAVTNDYVSGKQQSLTRHKEEAARVIGEMLLPALRAWIDLQTAFWKTVKEWPVVFAAIGTAITAASAALAIYIALTKTAIGIAVAGWASTTAASLVSLTAVGFSPLILAVGALGAALIVLTSIALVGWAASIANDISKINAETAKTYKEIERLDAITNRNRARNMGMPDAVGGLGAPNMNFGAPGIFMKGVKPTTANSESWLALQKQFDMGDQKQNIAKIEELNSVIASGAIKSKKQLDAVSSAYSALGPLGEAKAKQLQKAYAGAFDTIQEKLEKFLAAQRELGDIEDFIKSETLGSLMAKAGSNLKIEVELIPKIATDLLPDSFEKQGRDRWNEYQAKLQDQFNMTLEQDSALNVFPEPDVSKMQLAADAAARYGEYMGKSATESEKLSQKLDVAKNIMEVLGIKADSFLGKLVGGFAAAEKLGNNIFNSIAKAGPGGDFGTFDFKKIDFTQLISSIAGVVGAFKKATDSASSFQRAVGGAALGAKVGEGLGEGIGMALGGPAGAELGAKIGKYGGLIIGGIAGIFSKPEWAKVGEEAGKVLGTKVSRELAEQIQKTAKDLKIDIKSASLLNLDKVMGDKDPRQFSSQISELMKGIASGAIPAKEGVVQIGKAFDAVKKAAQEAGRVGDATMVMMLKTARAAKDSGNPLLYTKEMQAHTAENLDKALAGLNKYTAGISKLDGEMGRMASGSGVMFMSVFNAIAKEKGWLAAIDATAESFEKLKKKFGGSSKDDVQKWFDVYETEIKKLQELQKTVGLSSDQESQLERLIQLRNAQGDKLATGNFGGNGQLAEDFAKLTAEYEKLKGYADNEILRGAMDAADGLYQMMVGLSDAGYMNVETFNVMGQTASDLFNHMTEGGMDTKSAISVLAPTIQAAIDAAAQFGVPLDADMQKLKEIAEQNGITFSTDPMLRMVQVLEAIAKVLGAELPNATKTFADSLNTIPREVNVDVNVRRRESGYSPDAGGSEGGPAGPPDQYAASGFYSASMPRGPRKEGMTYIGVHPGEEVSVTPANDKGKSRSSGSGGSSGSPQGDNVFNISVNLPGGEVLKFVERATKNRQLRVHPDSVRKF